ncbi:MAG: DUF4169 family protein [Alphaproteobacteria bacterium]|nr:DUF4169 family protein [Alphaproteobacteria bacterium]
MGEVINLNRYRKAMAKERGRRLAAENRARHGQGKTEREVSDLEVLRRERQLDGNKLDQREESPERGA